MTGFGIMISPDGTQVQGQVIDGEIQDQNAIYYSASGGTPQSLDSETIDLN
jgi:hypothetical protein